MGLFTWHWRDTECWQVRPKYEFTAKWVINLKRTTSSRTVIFDIFFRFFRWRRPKHKQISRPASFQCKYLTLERVSPPHAEPGYYKKNDYGIRLESILRVVRKTTPVRRTLTVISALAVYAVDKNPSINVTGSAGRERVLGLRDHHLGAVWTESYRAPIDDSQTGKRSQI